LPWERKDEMEGAALVRRDPEEQQDVWKDVKAWRVRVREG